MRRLTCGAGGGETAHVAAGSGYLDHKGLHPAGDTCEWFLGHPTLGLGHGWNATMSVGRMTEPCPLGAVHVRIHAPVQGTVYNDPPPGVCIRAGMHTADRKTFAMGGKEFVSP